MTAVSTPAPAVEPRDERHRRLVTGVAGLRSRAARAGDRDRYLLIGGGILVPLGLLLVVLGWVGASQTVLIFEQLPYIASGGLLGLALVVAGGFVYWSYWLTVLIREARADRTELTAGLGRMEDLLERVLLAQAPVLVEAFDGGGLVATPRGTMLHRPDCPTVVNRDDLRAVAADEPGMSPCRLCDPLADEEERPQLATDSARRSSMRPSASSR